MTYGKIAFIGAVRPNIGAIPSLSEYASLLTARVFSGKVELPPWAKAVDNVKDQHILRNKTFPIDGKRMKTLVHPVQYCDRIMQYLGLNYIFSLLPPITLFSKYPWIVA